MLLCRYLSVGSLRGAARGICDHVRAESHFSIRINTYSYQSQTTDSVISMARPKLSGRLIVLGTIIAMVTLGIGYAIASVTITNTSESAGGTYVGGQAITGWALAANPTSVVTIPSGLSAVSTTVGTPSVLAGASASYAVGTVTAGDIGQIVRFSETAGAPVSTEIEIAYTLVTGAGTTSTTAYVETQATAGAYTYTFYLDAGSATSATVTITSVTEIAQECSAVGTCP
jgi:hypothetical protein